MTEYQGDMDQLHDLHYSTEFSTDVNRKMQIPPRLSMDPEPDFGLEPPSPTPNLNLNMAVNGMDGSPAHAMNVPDRILIAGSDHHVGARQAPRDLDLDNVTRFPQAGDNFGLTTPPRTLTLDEVSFPTVGDAKSAMKAKKAQASVRPSVDSNASMLATDSTFMTEVAPSNDVARLHKQVTVLASKVAQMEELNDRRERREQIVMGVGILYLVFKGLRFLFRSPYP